jgi:hypothetical protein
VGWDQQRLWFTWLGELNFSNFEMLLILGFIEILSELINTINTELATECVNDTTWNDLITSKVVVSNEILSRLIN